MKGKERKQNEMKRKINWWNRIEKVVNVVSQSVAAKEGESSGWIM